MARAHCDDVIQPLYVREVCRLMRSSNINIIKNDVEFIDIQEKINEDRAKKREVDKLLGNVPMDQEPAQPVDTQQKVKITYDEYQKLSLMILTYLKEMERQG